MELIDAIQKVVEQYIKGSAVTDLTIGTVSKADPLEIILENNRLTLPTNVLLLTEGVVEKKIPVMTHNHFTAGLAHCHSITGLGHTHNFIDNTTDGALNGSYNTKDALTVDSLESSSSLENIACYENGELLPVKDGFIILNRGLEKGDRVLMLRVLSGQNYIVLSRIFSK